MKTINKKITTPDGFILDVIVFEPETPAKTEVFMCHGLTGSKDTKRNTLLNLAEKLCENGMRVIRFDFRGHGESSGIDLDVNLDSFIIDLDTVMRSERSDLQFMMFGFSFGGFTVSEYIHKKISIQRK
ncbi:MAG TPA: alpha/beta fold hydrolase [Candidatus Dojkabacteria bacterium]|nr:alpha/beta fold hydrolase [Candidatus Dojkabacteria bacterium]